MDAKKNPPPPERPFSFYRLATDVMAPGASMFDALQEVMREYEAETQAVMRDDEGGQQT